MASFLSLPVVSPRLIPTTFSLKRPFIKTPPTLHFKNQRFAVRCNNTEAGLAGDFEPSTSTIDVVTDVKTEKIVVLGGNGFVGSAICKAAVSKGIEVISVNRSGRPTYSESWIDQVTWIPGDVFFVNWDEILPGATAVVSTLGGFGTEEEMRKLNGEANVVAADAAKEYGTPKFIFISVHDYNLPPFLLTSWYFSGKRKAESEVLSKFPNSGIILRPGFIYGKRRVDGGVIPLDLIGEPVERILKSLESYTKPLSSLPASDIVLAPPISVDDVALAVINGVTDDDFFGVFTIEQIKEVAEKLRIAMVSEVLLPSSSVPLSSDNNVTPPTCRCGVQSRMRLVKTEENGGRRFWGCGRDRSGKNECSFFYWHDGELPKHLRNFIRDSIRENKELETEKVEMQGEIVDLQNLLENEKSENKKLAEKVDSQKNLINKIKFILCIAVIFCVGKVLKLF